MAQQTTLYTPDGRKYVTSDRAEVNRLKMAHGYSETKPKATTKQTPADAPASDKK